MILTKIFLFWECVREEIKYKTQQFKIGIRKKENSSKSQLLDFWKTQKKLIFMISKLNLLLQKIYCHK